MGSFLNSNALIKQSRSDQTNAWIHLNDLLLNLSKAPNCFQSGKVITNEAWHDGFAWGSCANKRPFARKIIACDPFQGDSPG